MRGSNWRNGVRWLNTSTGSNHNTLEVKLKTRERFRYMMLGGVFSATLIFVGMAVSPLTANRDTFGEITCTGLRVLYPDGTVSVYLGHNDDGGEVSCYDTAGNGQVSMQSSRKHGGSLNLFLAGDDTNFTPVSISANGRDGNVSIWGDTGVMMLDNNGFSMIHNPSASILRLEVDSHGHPIFIISNASNKDEVQRVEIGVTASGILTVRQADGFEGLGFLKFLTQLP